MPPLLHQYKITALYINGNDTCESGFSNTAADVCEGINDDGEKPFVNIYPNPCNNLLKIESSEELGMISIFNSFGSLMLKKMADEKQLEIPVSAYPAGIYMIRVQTGKEEISKKVVVLH
jgi:hypothetical protein